MRWILLFLFMTSSVFACSCLKWTSQEAFSEADVIFAGKVISVEEMEDFSSKTEFEVSRIWKGEADRHHALMQSGTSCDVFFTKGERYLVYQMDDTTGLCMGTTQLANADLDFLGEGQKVGSWFSWFFDLFR